MPFQFYIQENICVQCNLKYTKYLMLTVCGSYSDENDISFALVLLLIDTLRYKIILGQHWWLHSSKTYSLLSSKTYSLLSNLLSAVTGTNNLTNVKIRWLIGNFHTTFYTFYLNPFCTVHFANIKARKVLLAQMQIAKPFSSGSSSQVVTLLKSSAEEKA